MNEDMVMTIGAEAIRTTIYLASPMLVAAMAVGIIVSVFQAITQINEATLTFIPKMAAVILVLVLLAPWMIRIMSEYTAQVMSSAGDMVR